MAGLKKIADAYVANGLVRVRVYEATTTKEFEHPVKIHGALAAEYHGAGVRAKSGSREVAIGFKQPKQDFFVMLKDEREVELAPGIEGIAYTAFISTPDRAGEQVTAERFDNIEHTLLDVL